MFNFPSNYPLISVKENKKESKIILNDSERPVRKNVVSQKKKKQGHIV